MYSSFKTENHFFQARNHVLALLIYQINPGWLSANYFKMISIKIKISLGLPIIYQELKLYSRTRNSINDKYLSSLTNVPSFPLNRSWS